MAFHVGDLRSGSRRASGMRIGIQTKRTAVNAQPVTLSPESERSE
jgi:hypothetical protein